MLRRLARARAKTGDALGTVCRMEVVLVVIGAVASAVVVLLQEAVRAGTRASRWRRAALSDVELVAKLQEVGLGDAPGTKLLRAQVDREVSLSVTTRGVVHDPSGDRPGLPPLSAWQYVRAGAWTWGVGSVCVVLALVDGVPAFLQSLATGGVLGAFAGGVLSGVYLLRGRRRHDRSLPAHHV